MAKHKGMPDSFFFFFNDHLYLLVSFTYFPLVIVFPSSLSLNDMLFHFSVLHAFLISHSAWLFIFWLGSLGSFSWPFQNLLPAFFSSVFLPSSTTCLSFLNLPLNPFPVWYPAESEVAQLCPTLCNPMDCSLPGSSLHGILQARVLEWVAISFSRGSSQLRDWTQVSCIPGRCFNLWATREAYILQSWF